MFSFQVHPGSRRTTPESPASKDRPLFLHLGAMWCLYVPARSYRRVHLFRRLSPPSPPRPPYWSQIFSSAAVAKKHPRRQLADGRRTLSARRCRTPRRRRWRSTPASRTGASSHQEDSTDKKVGWFYFASNIF